MIELHKTKRVSKFACLDKDRDDENHRDGLNRTRKIIVTKEEYFFQRVT